MAYATTNPYTGEVLKTFPNATDAEVVFMNHPTMVKADLPFGGIRHSGYGRELMGPGITSSSTTS